jgi:hypothetical protein
MTKKASTLKPFVPKIDRRILRNTLKQKRKQLRTPSEENGQVLPKQMTVGEMFRRYRKLETDMQRFRTEMAGIASKTTPMSDVMSTVEELLQSDVPNEPTEPESEV